MKKGLITALLFAGAIAACRTQTGRAPAPDSSDNENAIKGLGSAVPASRYDQSYWQKQHDARTSEWEQAKRLCGQTLLANYPNCIPINDILQADQRKKAIFAKSLDARREEMFRRGYRYDDLRKAWLPFRDMYVDGCIYAPAYPNEPARVGSTWRCSPGTVIPKGIADDDFSKEEEDATD